MLKNEGTQPRFSKPIVKLSILSIALGVTAMIVSVAIATGFQQEIRDKVIGFGAHIQITHFDANPSNESDPILLNQEFYTSLKEEKEIKNIQAFALKPAMLQSEKTQADGNVQREIQGVVTKGVASDYDWSFFQKNLVSGRVPETGGQAKRYEDLLISSDIAGKLDLQTGDTVSGYFIREGKPFRMRFEVCGIYSTGLEEFDRQFVFIDLRHIRYLSHWGIEASLYIRPQSYQGKLVVEAFGRGTGNFVYDFGRGAGTRNYLLLEPGADTSVQVIIASADPFEPYGSYSETQAATPQWLPDTAWLHIRYSPAVKEGHPYSLTEEPLIEQQGDTQYVYRYEGLTVTTHLRTSGGSGSYYTGGFEILLHDWTQLQKADEIVYRSIPPEFRTQTIHELYEDLFKWLELLDMNVVVILVLMLVVSLINMCSTLLVLILERTSMIGLLKAMGAGNRLLRRIFIWNGIFLVSRGLLIGNLVGVGLVLVQHYTSVLQLDESTYFISFVPVRLDIFHLLLLNAGTLCICFLTLLLPAFLVARISPVKAIRFT